MTISAIDLAQMRSDADGLRTTSVVLYSRKETKTKGSVAVTYPNAGTVDAFVAPETRIIRSTADGEKFEMHSVWKLHVAWNQALKSGDKVVAASQTYLVQDIDDAHSWRPWKTATLIREEDTNA